MKKEYVRPTSELVYAEPGDSFLEPASTVTADGESSDVNISTDGTQVGGGNIEINARGESSWGNEMW